MLGTSLFVNAYVMIDNGCPVALSVLNDDQVEIVCGWPPGRTFEFVMHREALRAFVELGSEALERMDAAFTANSPAPSASAC